MATAVTQKSPSSQVSLGMIDLVDSAFIGLASFISGPYSSMTCSKVSRPMTRKTMSNITMTQIQG